METRNFENKDSIKPDFRKIFKEKLESIEPISEKEQKDAASGFEDVGIEKIKKEIPAMIIRMAGNEDFDLWIEDSNNFKNVFEPHDELRGFLCIFLNIKDEYDPKFPRFQLGGTILQDESNSLYLLMDEIREDGLRGFMKIEEVGPLLLDLLRVYNIKKVIGRFSKEERGKKFSGFRTASRDIIDEDLIGKRRELFYFVNLARKYNMTNAQFLRLRVMGLSAFQAGVSINLEDIAKEIIKDD